jgi:phosphatidylserine decarboxylase
MMAFETVDDATRIWIKGREFSVQRLLGDAFRDEAKSYEGGALAIFRLAPQVRFVRSLSSTVSLVDLGNIGSVQDYHRYHSPVDGMMDEWSDIPGELYTVNPMACVGFSVFHL